MIKSLFRYSSYFFDIEPLFIVISRKTEMKSSRIMLSLKKKQKSSLSSWWQIIVIEFFIKQYLIN